jgi:hypothetical protein
MRLCGDLSLRSGDFESVNKAVLDAGIRVVRIRGRLLPSETANPVRGNPSLDRPLPQHNFHLPALPSREPKYLQQYRPRCSSPWYNTKGAPQLSGMRIAQLFPLCSPLATLQDTGHASMSGSHALAISSRVSMVFQSLLHSPPSDPYPFS